MSLRLAHTPQAVLHPVVMTALVANAGAALHGIIMKVDYTQAQKVYYSKVRMDADPRAFVLTSWPPFACLLCVASHQRQGRQPPCARQGRGGAGRWLMRWMRVCAPVCPAGLGSHGRRRPAHVLPGRSHHLHGLPVRLRGSAAGRGWAHQAKGNNTAVPAQGPAHPPVETQCLACCAPCSLRARPVTPTHPQHLPAARDNAAPRARDPGRHAALLALLLLQHRLCRHGAGPAVGPGARAHPALRHGGAGAAHQRAVRGACRHHRRRRAAAGERASGRASASVGPAAPAALAGRGRGGGASAGPHCVCA